MTISAFLCCLQRPEQCSCWDLGSQQGSSSNWSWQAQGILETL